MSQKTVKPDNKSPQKTEICEKLINRIIQRRTFEPFDRPTVGCRFLRFTRRGESVRGWLGFPVPNFRQGTSYPFELDDGEVVEIIGNKLLHKQIRDGELCGCYIEIVYLGREFRGGGHHRKIYRVFKIDKPQLSKKDWEKIIEGSKNGKGRKTKNHVLSQLSTTSDAHRQ